MQNSADMAYPINRDANEREKDPSNRARGFAGLQPLWGLGILTKNNAVSSDQE